MKRGRSTGNATKGESQWIGATKRNGCLCCMAMGFKHDSDGPVVEAHHLLSGGIRRGHFYTVGLCAWHHRARLIVNAWTHDTHRRLLGPSLEEGSARFHERFGTDEQLLREQIALNKRHGLSVRHPQELSEAA
jgi:hypothetical protein